MPEPVTTPSINVATRSVRATTAGAAYICGSTTSSLRRRPSPARASLTAPNPSPSGETRTCGATAKAAGSPRHSAAGEPALAMHTKRSRNRGRARARSRTRRSSSSRVPGQASDGSPPSRWPGPATPSTPRCHTPVAARGSTRMSCWASPARRVFAFTCRISTSCPRRCAGRPSTAALERRTARRRGEQRRHD